MDKQPETIEWKALEYDYREKTPDWFWIVGIITVALVFASILLENLLLGLLTGIAGFSIALYGAKKPATVNFRINHKGIQIADKLYDYGNLRSFWINYDPPHSKELIIESKKTFMPHIYIMLGDADPEKIREYLMQFIKEDPVEESITTTIIKLIKF